MKTLLVARIALAVVLTTGFGLAFGQTFTVPAQDGPRLRTAPAPAQLGLWQADERPKLGVMVEETEDGIVIDDVVPDSLASAAGVEPGDILLSMDGRRLEAVSDIGDILMDLGPGAKVAITVVREGEGLVKLKGKLPEKEAPHEEHLDEDVFHADGHGGAFLGVMIGEESDGGVVIDDVVAHSAAWYCGLSDGDVLLGIDGKGTGSGDALVSAVASFSPGDEVEVRFRRDGKAHERVVRLGSHQASQPLGMLMGPEGLQGLHGLHGLLAPDGDHAPRRFQVRPGQWRSMFGDDARFQNLFKGRFGKLDEDGNTFFFRMHGDDDDSHGDDDDHHAFFFDADGHATSLDGDDIEAWVSDLGGHGVSIMMDGEVILGDEDGDEHQVRIRIEDGKVQIDRDGEVQVIELDGDDDNENVRFVVPGGAGQAMVIPSGKGGACVISSGGQVGTSSCADGAAVATIALTADGETCTLQTLECCTDTEDCGAAVEACAAVATDCEVAVEACADVAAECAAAAEACAEVAAECAVVVEACADVATECDAVVEVVVECEDEQGAL